MLVASASIKSSFVILSGAKDLSLGRAQILRGVDTERSECTQDDSSAEVHAYGAIPFP